MRIVVNGEFVEAAEGISLMELLSLLAYHQSWIAVAIDGHFVPRHTWTDRIVQSGQEVDVVSPRQGG